MARSSAITNLIPTDVLPFLERRRFLCSRRFTNLHAGEHLKGKGGSSTEFADYRDYVEGDDLRYIDWNILARLRRPYVKVFHREEDMHVVFLIDGSESMRFSAKFDQARRVAAALGTCSILQQEKVSVYITGQESGVLPSFSPASGRSRLPDFYRYLEGKSPIGSGTLEQAVETVSRMHRGKGVIVLLSDFLTYADLDPVFNRLLHVGLEPYGIQILSPEEQHPDLDRDVRLHDAETGQELDVSGQDHLLDLYQEMRLQLEERLRNGLRRRGGRFLSIGSELPLRDLVSDLLPREGWIG